MNISNRSKDIMVKEFGFSNSEILDIENFMNDNNLRSAIDILKSLIDDDILTDRQKIVISYIIGTSVLESKDIEMGYKTSIFGNFGGRSGG